MSNLAPDLADVLSELRALRTGVDRLHQRWDADGAECKTLEPASEEEIKFLQSEHLRIWSGHADAQ